MKRAILVGPGHNVEIVVEPTRENGGTVSFTFAGYHTTITPHDADALATALRMATAELTSQFFDY